MKTFIYSILDPRLNKLKIYVGKSNTPMKRFKSHISESNNLNKNTKKCNWLRSIRKEGLIPIFNIIEEITIEEWQIKENYYIDLYKSLGYELINIRPGGNGISIHSDNTCYKISTSRRGIKTGPRSEETKIRISVGHIGIGKGIQKSKEEKEKISNGLKKAYSENRKKKLTGIKITEEHRKKIGMGLTNNPLRQKKIIQSDPNNNIIKEWICAKEICKFYGYSESGIRLCCTGRTKQAYGYYWKYIV